MTAMAAGTRSVREVRGGSGRKKKQRGGSVGKEDEVKATERRWALVRVEIQSGRDHGRGRANQTTATKEHWTPYRPLGRGILVSTGPFLAPLQFLKID